MVRRCCHDCGAFRTAVFFKIWLELCMASLWLLSVSLSLSLSRERSSSLILFGTVADVNPLFMGGILCLSTSVDPKSNVPWRLHLHCTPCHPCLPCALPKLTAMVSRSAKYVVNVIDFTMLALNSNTCSFTRRAHYTIFMF